MATNELSRSTLLRKDRDELVTIAQAMGGKPGSRTRKAQVVEMILKMAGIDEDAATPPNGDEAESPDNGSDSDPAGDAGAEPDSVATGDADDEDDDDDENGSDGDRSADGSDDNGDSGEMANRRRRRRRGRDRDNEQHDTEPVDVAGYLDLRDDGYGFLRIDGAAPTKRDVYVSVKQVRQNGLRKGDHVTGKARPANRNEKNPALVDIASINGGDAATARDRGRFDDLTPVVPHQRIELDVAGNTTARAIDVLAPIGEGQRVLVKAPPRTGRTEVLIALGQAIASTKPDHRMFVVLIDERPEDVTVVARSLESAEMLSSTFDRPAEEHVMVAEMAIERAKRLVEAGENVVVLFDGLSRLARAGNLAAPGTGRTLSGGIDAAAVLAPRRWFGAARCIDGGGSLTVVATVTTQTGSALDDLVAGELSGKANTEICLDRALAVHRVFPAIVVDQTSSLNAEALVDDTTLARMRALREVLPEGTGINQLLELLASNETNSAMLEAAGR
jgi:transcription termination factor Rho